jgi:tRNA (guanine37-N1)-methyltransferase
MNFDILTIFPNFFAGPPDHGILNHGVLRRAIQTGLVQVRTHDLREFTHDRHRTVDDRPFGGGEGMVLKPDPIYACFETLNIAPKIPGAPSQTASPSGVGSNASQSTYRDPSRETVILLSAQGRPFTQSIAHELAAFDRVVFLCGRYEGVDERINQLLCDRELSIGDYVLSGGELAAAVILDTVVRLLPGVLGNPDSAVHESFGAPDLGAAHAPGAVPPATHGSGGLLDYPHYTRPADFRGLEVPAVLLEGDHAAIRRWRRQQSLLKTHQNRPDLLQNATLTDEDRAFLATLEP